MASSKYHPPLISNRSPVFVHSSFRTGSTWLWAEFRKSRDTVAYYEIFHETLGGLTPGKIKDSNSKSWNSHHPEISAYFSEFLPLIEAGGGVAGYQSRMASPGFVPAGGLRGAVDDAEKAYVEGLIAAAKAIDKTAVLTDTRTLGRMAGLKNSIPGLHIFLFRNLMHQWCSYHEQLYNGNTYFLDTIYDSVYKNADDRFLKELSLAFPLQQGSYDGENYFVNFIALHIYLYVNAIEVADLSIDLNRMADDRDYSRSIERAIEVGSSISLDLSNAASATAFSFVDMGPREQLFDTIKAITDLAVSRAARTQVGRNFAGKLLADLLDEYERSRFYTRRLVGFVNGPDGVLAARDRATSEKNAQASARAGLEAQVADLALERDRALLERNAIIIERDAAVLERNTAAVERDAVITERDSAVSQRNTAAVERDAVITERDALATACDAAVEERLAVVLERDTAIAQRNAAISERDALVRERDVAVSDLENARAHLIVLEATQAMLRKDNGRLTAKHGELTAANRDMRRARRVLLAEVEVLIADRATSQTRIDAATGQRDRAIGKQKEMERDLTLTQRRAMSLAAALRSTSRRELDLLFEQRLTRNGRAGPQADWIAVSLPHAVRLSLARRAAREKKWSAAELWYASILRRRPNASHLLIQYGHALKEQSVHALAAVAYSRAAAISGPNVDLTAHLIDALRSSGVPRDDEASWGVHDASCSPLDARPIPP